MWNNPRIARRLKRHRCSSRNVFFALTRNLSKHVVDPNWRIAAPFSRVCLDTTDDIGLWVTVRPETTGPVPHKWELLTLHPHSTWDYDDLISSRMRTANYKNIVLDFRTWLGFIPLDKTLQAIKDMAIRPLFVTHDVSLDYARKELGFDVRAYPASVSVSRISAPGTPLLVKRQSNDDQTAFTYLVGLMDNVVVKRTQDLVQLDSRCWGWYEHRLVITGSERSANLVAEILRRGDPGTIKPFKKRPIYTPFTKHSVRTLNSPEDLRWFRNVKGVCYLVVSLDVVGRKLALLTDFSKQTLARCLFAYVINPPTDLLGVAAWKVIRKLLFTRVTIGWGYPELIFLRWRRGALAVDGAADVLHRIVTHNQITQRKEAHVQDTVQPDSGNIPTPRLGTPENSPEAICSGSDQPRIT